MPLDGIREIADHSPGHPAVSGFLHVPAGGAGDGLVLTHGAGANCRSALLTTMANAFCASGITVLRCDLPFRQERPHGPPMRGSAEKDQAGLRRAVEWMKQQVSGRMFLGGHSYGGRQSTMLAAREPGLVEGLLLLSYPLHPPKRPEQMRTAHFPDLRTPSLFVHGSRDGFGSIGEMTEALSLIRTRTELLPVTGVGHELLPKRVEQELPQAIVDAFRTFFGE